PPGWTRRTSTPGGDLLENSAVLPRAFVPATVRSVPDGDAILTVLKTITDFSAEGVYSAAPADPPGEAIRNGPARVTIASSRPQALALDIDAAAAAVIATSMPAWRGWKATLDGAPIEPLMYNAAFLGYHAPAGRHRLELRYVPDSFRAGVLVTA